MSAFTAVDIIEVLAATNVVDVVAAVDVPRTVGATTAVAVGVVVVEMAPTTVDVAMVIAALVGFTLVARVAFTFDETAVLTTVEVEIDF